MAAWNTCIFQTPERTPLNLEQACLNSWFTIRIIRLQFLIISAVKMRLDQHVMYTASNQALMYVPQSLVRFIIIH